MNELLFKRISGNINPAAADDWIAGFKYVDGAAMNTAKAGREGFERQTKAPE
jgi:hypothetical protein